VIACTCVRRKTYLHCLEAHFMRVRMHALVALLKVNGENSTK